MCLQCQTGRGIRPKNTRSKETFSHKTQTNCRRIKIINAILTPTSVAKVKAPRFYIALRSQKPRRSDRSQASERREADEGGTAVRSSNQAKHGSRNAKTETKLFGKMQLNARKDNLADTTQRPTNRSTICRRTLDATRARIQLHLHVIVNNGTRSRLQ